MKKKARNEKDRKKIKTALKYTGRFFSVLGVTLFALLLTVYCTGLIVTHGPSVKARDLLVQTLNETSAAKWVPKLFLSGSAIDGILNAAKTDTNPPEPVNPGLIVVPTSEDDTSAGYEEHSVFVPHKAPDFEIDDDKVLLSEDGITIVEVDGGSYHGYMMIVSDPSRVCVATLDSYGPDAKGITLSGFMQKYDAVAGINAGGFQDPNGSGTGGIPDGLVIGHSEILWGGENTKYNCVIGFDKNNILHVGTFSGREALEADIVSAVSFAPGPVLIVNGKPLNENRPFKGGLNPRTAIGQRADGAVLLLVVDGRQPQSLGASYDDLVDIMLQFNAVNAANLDGGSSTRMHYGDRYINDCASVIGQRGLPDVILVLKGEK